VVVVHMGIDFPFLLFSLFIPRLVLLVYAFFIPNAFPPNTVPLWADIVQTCAVTGDDLPVAIEEPLALRFVPEAPVTDEEIELEEEELDEIPYTGSSFDLGEAVAQSLALAIDPFATGPDADRVRKEKGLLDEGASGPFAALAALKKD